MSTQIGKMTVSLPLKLISFADSVAKETRTSRSKVVSSCLRNLERERLHKEMEEGYRVMAEEHARFAQMTSEIAHEVVPKWG